MAAWRRLASVSLIIPIASALRARYYQLRQPSDAAISFAPPVTEAITIRAAAILLATLGRSRKEIRQDEGRLHDNLVRTRGGLSP